MPQALAETEKLCYDNNGAELRIQIKDSGAWPVRTAAANETKSTEAETGKVWK